MREVAREAGVSPALGVIISAARRGLSPPSTRRPCASSAPRTGGRAGRAGELLRQRAAQTAPVMRERPDVCAYLGRALVEVTPGARASSG